jgi:TrmH family RNA methyltransferase
VTTPIPPLTTGNARVKAARKLSRRSERSERRLFLADGPKAIEAAVEVEGCIVEVFSTVVATVRYGDLCRAVARTGAAWVEVDERALVSLSDSVNPAGVVAVCRFLDVPVAEVVESAPGTSAGPPGDTRLLAICVDVRNPGNAGTVIRTADAAGADGVVLAGNSVDAYNPKTVRASVGSLFRVPLAVETDPAAAVGAARDAGLTVLAADGDGEVSLDDAQDLLSGPTAWLFGNEAWGLPDGTAALADHRVRIPIHGRAESLNISTAAALCLYASASAHRRPGQRGRE